MKTEQGQVEEAPNENEEPQEEQEQPPPQEPEASEVPAENVDAEAAPEGTETPEAAPNQEEEQRKAEEKHRRAGGWQRKIEKLERINEQLIQQLTTSRPQQQPAGQEQPKDAATQMQEYIRAEARAVLAAEREQERQRRVQDDFKKRTQEVRAAYPDFDEVLMSADVPVSQALHDALLTSEHSGIIMYQLAKNPAELVRLSALPPLDAAREIGRLEAKASVTAAPKAPQKPAIRPPVPPTTVAGSPSSTRNLDDLPIAEYKRAYRSGRR